MLSRSLPVVQSSRLAWSSFSKCRLSNQASVTRITLARVCHSRTFTSSRSWLKDYPAHQVITMPALSPTMTQGSIGPWKKSVGDELAPGDVLVEIETDKAMMDFENQDEGFLAKILLKEGEKDIQVGTPIAVLAEEEGDVKAFEDFEASAESSGSSGNNAPAEEAPKKEEKSSAPAEKAPSQTKSTTSSSDRTFASPAARKEAEARNVDVSSVKATGKTEFTNEPRVVLSDVKSHRPAAAKAPAAQASAAPAAGSAGTYEDIELSNMRKTIAQRLTESKNTAPHYNVAMSINMTEVIRLRKELNDYAAKSSQSNYKLTMNDFVIKASALALRDVPEVNASWINDNGNGKAVIRQYKNVDVSVAVATPTGLLTPIITNADQRGLAGISSTMKELGLRARENKLKVHEIQGGTFAVSNLGMFGVDDFTAIINPPQSSILAVGASTEVLRLKDSKIVAEQQMKVTICCDHRVFDGAIAARWLGRFRTYMENPKLMLL